MGSSLIMMTLPYALSLLLIVSFICIYLLLPYKLITTSFSGTQLSRELKAQFPRWFAIKLLFVRRIPISISEIQLEF